MTRDMGDAIHTKPEVMNSLHFTASAEISMFCISRPPPTAIHSFHYTSPVSCPARHLVNPAFKKIYGLRMSTSTVCLQALPALGNGTEDTQHIPNHTS